MALQVLSVIGKPIMSWRTIFTAIAIIVVIIAGTVFYMKSGTSSTPTMITNVSNISGHVIVFCAGSLYIPLQELKEVFEEKFPGVEVVIEPSGSVMAVRKVVELNRRCDVIALADYRLIPKYMVPNYTKWYVAFATNEIVLCYTDKSRYADEINADNWYEILLRPNVKYGFSNPNDDPCGYRAVTVLGLASLLYGENILDKLVLSRTNIKAKEVDGELHIYVPSELEVYSENLVIRSKSVDLIALLEAGALDYAFEYRSVAVQHNLKFIELPRELNLGDPEMENFYSKVTIHILCGTDKEKAIRGAAIVYGVAVPLTVENYDGALEFIKMLLSSTGKSIFEKHGQPFLEELMYFGDVPEVLKS